jgi:hypothetical protein
LVFFAKILKNWCFCKKWHLCKKWRFCENWRFLQKIHKNWRLCKKWRFCKNQLFVKIGVFHKKFFEIGVIAKKIENRMVAEIPAKIG